MSRLERQRLEALYDLEILDTPPEEHLDRVCRLAARTFRVPIALFSLVDRERLWFKSRHGLDVESAPREASFCDNATREGELLIVPDAHRDLRFVHGPLVTGPPHIRFYAGVPIRDGLGNNLGTFCIIDSQPRTMDQDDIDLLNELAGVVQDHILYLRAARRSGETATVDAYLRGLLAAADRPVIITDMRDRVRYHNPAARPYLGIADPVGRPFDDVRSEGLAIEASHTFREGLVEGTVYEGAPAKEARASERAQVGRV